MQIKRPAKARASAKAGLTTTHDKGVFVMATRSLSPKRAAERMRRFQSAVRTIALFKAKKLVQAQIRARGQRISDYSCRDISLLAHAHLAQHQEELINKATAVVATFKEFAGCVELLINAQSENGPISTTSTVQILGAK